MSEPWSRTVAGGDVIDAHPHRAHQLRVTFTPAAEGDPHHYGVYLRHGTAPHAAMWFPSGKHPDKSYVMSNSHRSDDEYLAPPSEQLREMIRHYHTGSVPWYALLDRLVEEYPELQPAADAHVAARNES